MPINTVKDNNQAVYYTFNSSFLKTETKNGIEIEKKTPGLTFWTGQENVFVASSIGGCLTSITLGKVQDKKKKDGTPFTIQNVFLEFHSEENGELVREVTVFSADSNITRNIISKLLNAKDYSDINLKFLSIAKDGKENVVVMLYQGEGKQINKLEHSIIIKKEGEKYDNNLDVLYVPVKKYISEDGTITTDWNKAMKNKNIAITNPKWQEEMTNVYFNAIETINERLIPYEIKKEKSQVINRINGESYPFDEFESDVEQGPF